MQFYDSSSGFQQYLKAVDRFPLLDREGELDLATRYHAGDSEAGEALVNANLRNVVKISMRYKGYGYKVSCVS
jgi:RNA polymerase primary sigma factor